MSKFSSQSLFLIDRALNKIKETDRFGEFEKLVLLILGPPGNLSGLKKKATSFAYQAIMEEA
jgi:hypothetical protein